MLGNVQPYISTHRRQAGGTVGTAGVAAGFGGAPVCSWRAATRVSFPSSGEFGRANAGSQNDAIFEHTPIQFAVALDLPT